MTISREVLGKYVHKNVVLYETGTKWGDTVIAAIELGASAVSCESDPIAADIARAHVMDATHQELRVENTDSVSFLGSRIGPELGDDDMIVFLDAHTATNSPLLSELSVISGWARKPRFILIDDVSIIKSGAWGFGMDEVLLALKKIGPHELSFEDGKWTKEDILVAKFS